MERGLKATRLEGEGGGWCLTIRRFEIRVAVLLVILAGTMILF